MAQLEGQSSGEADLFSPGGPWTGKLCEVFRMYQWLLIFSRCLNTLSSPLLEAENIEVRQVDFTFGFCSLSSTVD